MAASIDTTNNKTKQGVTAKTALPRRSAAGRTSVKAIRHGRVKKAGTSKVAKLGGSSAQPQALSAGSPLQLLALLNSPAPSAARPEVAVLPPRPPFPLFIQAAAGKENAPRSCTWRPRRADTAALFQRPLASMF